jgi:hypothetical protein
MSIYKDNWKKYHDLGLTPYPAHQKSKGPIPGWKKDIPLPTIDEFHEWAEQYPDANIWTLLVNGFVVLDPDCPEAEEFVQSLKLPKCPTSVSGNRSTHRWFKMAQPIKAIKTSTGGGQTFLELRAGRMGMLAPPSLHPVTQKEYRWLEGHSPWEISFPDFPKDAYIHIQALMQKTTEEEQEEMENRLDIKRYLDDYRIGYQIKQLNGERILYALEWCLFADQHTTPDNAGDSGIIQGPDGKPGYHCFHNHCASKTWHDARMAISGNDSVTRFYRNDIPLAEAKATPNWEQAVMSIGDLRTTKFPEKRKIISPWLSEQSIVLVAGWRGVGKTWFAVGLVDAVTRGMPFGPWKTITPVSCLYVDGEMAVQDAQERANLLELSAEQESKEQLLVYSDFWGNSLGLPKANLLNPVWREWVKKKSLEWNIKLVVLDNLSSLCPGIDENSKKEWDPINQWLLEMRFSGISTLMLHHTNKEGGQRGTSGREDNLDISILLTEPKDYLPEEGARFIVKFSKARIRHGDLPSITDMEFHLREVEGRLQWIFGSAKRKNRIEVLRLLSEGVPQKEIPEMVKISTGQVSKIKSSLIADDLLTKKGTLTMKGKAMLSEGL